MRSRLGLVTAMLISLGACGGGDTEESSSRGDGASPSATSPAEGDLDALAEKVLSEDPHAPADVNLFPPETYTVATPLAVERSPDLTDDQGRDALTGVLDQWVDDPSDRELALSTYDDPDVVALIPDDPYLRAGFAYASALHGTDLLPTNPPYTNMRLSGSVAMATAMANVGTIIVNALKTPPLESMPALLEHEGQHTDVAVGLPEGVILNAYTAARYFQVLVENPELAYEGSDGTRTLNVQLLMLLDAHATGRADLDLYATTPQGVDPGGATEYARFSEAGWGRIGIPEDSTPMPEPFRDLLADELGSQVPEALEFSSESAALMDQLLERWMSPVDRLRVEVLLTMRSLDEVAELSGLGQDEAVETFGLQPYLDAAA
jgi:hypothetical protein